MGSVTGLWSDGVGIDGVRGGGGIALTKTPGTRNFYLYLSEAASRATAPKSSASWSTNI